MIRSGADGTVQYLQVKGRVLLTRKRNGRLGSLNITDKWDAVLLVLMDLNFETLAIFEAPRAQVIEAIQRPGGKARNERRALSISGFCSLGTQIWPPTP